MGCLTATIRRATLPPTATLTREGGELECALTKEGGLEFSASRIGGDLTFDAQRIGAMKARIALVCPTALGLYMLELADGTPVLTLDGGYIFVKGR